MSTRHSSYTLIVELKINGLAGSDTDPLGDMPQASSPNRTKFK
jgi:hypothetical protein